MATVVEPAAANRTKGRILIVDDELVVRDSLGKWFTSEGYTAKPANGGSPSKLARNTVRAIAASGLRFTNPRYAPMSSLPVAFRTRATTPNAPRFIATYTNRCTVCHDS